MKTTDEIYGGMLEAFESETGMKLSSEGELALRLRAIAAQVSALHYQADWTLKQCFPQTASGVYLDMFAAIRGLSRREAAAAKGAVRFYLSGALETDIEIPAGTVCLSGGQVRFLTDSAQVIKAGETYADAAVTAASAGSHGNVGAGSITAMAVAPVGVQSCVNLLDFSGGSDSEQDEELRERILDTYAMLPNGANTAYYKGAAMSIAGVADVHVIPRVNGRGTVALVISSESGLPSDELLEKVGTYIEEMREIAVDVIVRAPGVVGVAVDAAVKLEAGYEFADVSGSVRSAVSGFFGGGTLGKSVTLAALGALIYAVPGVKNYKISSPSADIVIEPDQLPELLSLNITQMGG